MYDHRHLRSKKVSWLYEATLRPFGFLCRFTNWVTVGMLIAINRYKPQLGNPEVPRRWVQTNTAISGTHFNAPGIRDAAPIMVAVRTPAITRVVIGEDLESDIEREAPSEDVEKVSSSAHRAVNQYKYQAS